MESHSILSEAAVLYLSMLEKAGKHKRTLYTYGKDLEQIQLFFGPERPIKNITAPQIGRFLKSDALLRLPNGKERAFRTMNKTIRVFRMFMTWLYKEGILTELNLPKSISLKGNSSSYLQNK